MAKETEVVLTEENGMSPESETPDATEEKTIEADEGKEPLEGDQEPGSVAFDGDITKLPPSLQIVAKQFQADYTRKMQTLKEAIQGISSHRDRLALLDNAVAGDPKARKALGDLFGSRTTETPKPEMLPENFKDMGEMVNY